MGRPIRDRNPKNLHLVTVRTEEARYYLRPSKDIKRIVAGVLARYQEIFGITIYTFVIMSNPAIPSEALFFLYSKIQYSPRNQANSCFL